MRKKFIVMFVALCAAAMILPVAGCEKGSVKSIDAGTTWEVAETTHLKRLTIANGAVVKAPEGQQLSMTVDQVETDMKPGTYEGDIVLTPTEDIVVADSMHGRKYKLRAAVYVDNGAVVPAKSVMSAVSGGEVTDSAATGVSITSVGENFNGIIATGKSTYAIHDPKINLTGNGGNDFAGYGAAVMTSGNADVTVDNASIVTNGCIRTAVWVGGESTIHVNDSYIETGSPPLPEDYKDVFTEGGTAMMTVPFMLGLTGTCRATNLLDKGTAYYTKTHIKAKGWGCLSIDAAEDVKLFATDCIIETVDSGYGAYSIGGSVDTFSGCTFNVADMAVCGTGGDCVFTDGTVVNSRRFGVMYHGSGDITLENGTVFNTKSTAIQLKSPGHTVIVDNARVDAENGIILQVMANDDPNQQGGGMPEGETPEGAKPEGGAPPEGVSPTAGAPVASRTGTNAIFRNAVLSGDIFNGNTAFESLSVDLEKATITGAITTTTVVHALGPNGEQITMQTPELYYLIGKVTNTPSAKPEDPHGLTVSLDESSKWVVDKTCYLTGLRIVDGGVVTAPEGARVTMTVDGKETPITAGTYSGQIVLAVATP